MHDLSSRPTTDKKRLLLPKSSQDPGQQRLMAWALGVLLVTLGVVLYADRDFWFPAPEEATERALATVQSATVAGARQEVASAPSNEGVHRKSRGSRGRPTTVPTDPVDSPTPPVSVTRTVLPPLEVEVVAGDNHKNLTPGSNSLKVDLESGRKGIKGEEAPVQEIATADNVVVNAAGHTDVASNSGDVVSHAVQPGYPMLARQMKVQGAVVLLALIGRDGLIQNLNIVSGPPILARAAREAVTQWHFKPHYEGSQPVETQAKITVNFTISTN